MRNITNMKNLILILIAVFSTGCALTDNYEFGDITKDIVKPLVKVYCLSENEELREETKIKLLKYGISIEDKAGVDFCTLRGYAKAIKATVN